MQNNVFLRLAQERYTTKHYNGQQISGSGAPLFCGPASGV